MQSDLLVWKEDKTSSYSAKGGYQWSITASIQTGNGSNTTGSQDDRIYYTNLWSLSVPSKIKIHPWRITKNYLPTLSNLKARSLRREAACPLCGESEDSVEHIFRDCLTTQQILKMLIDIGANHAYREWRQWLVVDFNNLIQNRC